MEREHELTLSCKIGGLVFKRDALLEETWEPPLRGSHGCWSLDGVGLRLRRRHLG